MKRYFLLGFSFLFILNFNTGWAQETTDNKNNKALILKTCLTCLHYKASIIGEFQLKNRKSIEVEVMGFYPSFILTWVPEMVGRPLVFQYGIGTNVGYVTYFKKKRNLYFQPSIAIKYKWRNNFQYYTSLGSSGTHITLDQSLFQVNPRIVFGVSKQTDRLKLDFYYGAGLDISQANTKYKSWWNYDCLNCGIYSRNKPIFDNGLYFTPTIHLGLRLGVKVKQ